MANEAVLATASVESAVEGAGFGVWPPDCTRDIPRDGLVLIDGAPTAQVLVSLRTTSEGSTDLEGAFDTDAASGARVWRSAEPLLPAAEYRLEVQPVDAKGAAYGEPLLSYFTTGDQLQGELAFKAAPIARVLPHDAAAVDTSVLAESSMRDDVVVMRVAVQGLMGGLPHRALRVHAELVDDTSAELAVEARVADQQAAAPHQPVAFQLQAMLGTAPSVRCVEILGVDDFGHRVAVEPQLCVELPARAAATNGVIPATEHDGLVAEGEGTADSEGFADEEEGVADTADAYDPDELDVEARQVWAGDEGLSDDEQGKAQDGCSVGSGASGRGLSWFALALSPLLIAHRRSKGVRRA